MSSLNLTSTKFLDHTFEKKKVSSAKTHNINQILLISKCLLVRIFIHRL